ncbi:MAG: segregation/condensation protein A [Candidatus Aenigmatarchaeota archaeon]
MEQEENILQLIIKKESWEEVIYHIVSIENLDPWNIDLIKLTNSFLAYINKVEELDFRIPAKIVFVAVVLLKLKADYLSLFEEEETFEKIEEKGVFEDLGINPNLIKLGIPMRRIPKRQVTLEELINALKKALAVRERKIERKISWKVKLQAEVGVEEDITKRINNVMMEIEELMKKLKQDRIEFKQIVEEWNRDQIVGHFVPLLHLEQKEKIKTEQKEFFKEIYILKQNAENQS